MRKLLILFLATLFISGCSLTKPQTSPQTASPSPVSQENSTEVVSDPTQITNPSLEITVTSQQAGVTVQEMLDAMGTVEYVDYGEAGKFVQSINGVAANNEHYWAFYINDEYSQKGVSDTTVQEGDIVKFVYETIDPDKL